MRVCPSMLEAEAGAIFTLSLNEVPISLGETPRGIFRAGYCRSKYLRPVLLYEFSMARPFFSWNTVEKNSN